MIVTDTSIVFSLYLAGDAHHDEVVEWYEAAGDVLDVTPLVVAEVDHLVRRWGRSDSVELLRADLTTGAIHVTWWATAMSETLAVAARRPDVNLADASLVALAAHRRTTRIATLDLRDFRSLQPLTGEDRFILLPADAD